VTVYVRVPDLQASLDRAEQLGGKTVMPPMHVMEGVDIALFTDPDGHVMGLLKG
jgi:predicted enzyme related to lactoylglutathione lyase